ncbi:MAG: hypothetical protein U0Q15_09325 [Kineosporiaceae bacterium]
MSVQIRSAQRSRAASGSVASTSSSWGEHIIRSTPLPSRRRAAGSTSTPMLPRPVRPTSRTSSVWVRLTSTWSSPRT